MDTPDPGREEEFDRRRAGIEALREKGIDAYPVRFERTRTAASLHAEFGSLAPGTETGVEVSVAGRLLLIRRQGKLAFATMRDGTATVQLFVSQAAGSCRSRSAGSRCWPNASGPCPTSGTA